MTGQVKPWYQRDSYLHEKKFLHPTLHLKEFLLTVSKGYEKQLRESAVPVAEQTIDFINRSSSEAWIAVISNFRRLPKNAASNPTKFIVELLKYMDGTLVDGLDISVKFRISEIRRFPSLPGQELTLQEMYQPDGPVAMVDESDTTHGLNPAAMAVLCYTRVPVTPCRELFIELMKRKADCSFLLNKKTLAWKAVAGSETLQNEVAKYLVRKDAAEFQKFAQACSDERTRGQEAVAESAFVMNLRKVVDHLDANATVRRCLIFPRSL